MVELYIMHDYFRNYFEYREKFASKKSIFLVSTIMVVLLFSANIQGSNLLNLVAFPLVMWLYVTILFEVNIGNRLIYFLIGYCLFVACEYLYGMLSNAYSMLADRKSYVELNQIPLQLLAMKLLTYILFTIVKQFSNKSKKRMSGKIFAMYICLPLASLGIMMSTYYSGINLTQNSRMMILILLCFILILLGNIFMFYAFNKYSEELYSGLQKQLVIERQERDLSYYMELQKRDERYSQFIHDVNHYFKAIGELAKEKNYDNILGILEELNIELENNEMMIYTNHRVVNAVLSEKRLEGERKKVVFDAYVEPGVEFGTISDGDLIAMLGNLLDNAITAADKCENDEREVVVRIYMENKGRFCVIKIVNHFVGNVIRNKDGFISTKKEKGVHGIGVKSIENTAEKYGGYLECLIGKSIFTAVLILPVLQ